MGAGDRWFESSRPDLKWLGITVASVAFGLPPIAFVVALVLVQGYAGIAYFAEGSSNQLQLSITTAGLTAGAVALVVAILLPAGDETAR